MQSQLKPNKTINLDIEGIFQSRFFQQDSGHYSEKCQDQDHTEKNNFTSPRETKMNTSEEIEDGYLFWYSILYAIGSYMIESVPKIIPTHNTMKKCKGNIATSSDVITRLFCGYWVLYTIAVTVENAKKHTLNESER